MSLTAHDICQVYGVERSEQKPIVRACDSALSGGTALFCSEVEASSRRSEMTHEKENDKQKRRSMRPPFCLLLTLYIIFYPDSMPLNRFL